MAENTLSGARLNFALTVVFVIIVGLAGRLFQVGLANTQIVIDPGARVAQAAPIESAAAVRLEWLGACYQPVLRVGVYAPGDAPCQPGRTLSLKQLQADLSARGLLQPGERLDYAPGNRARHLACWGSIVDGTQAAGWICSDAGGVYRLDMHNRVVGGRWQLRPDGSWEQARP